MNVVLTRDFFRSRCARSLLLGLLLGPATALAGQQGFHRFNAFTAVRLIESFRSEPPGTQQRDNGTPAAKKDQSETKRDEAAIPASKRQPKRILGIMPNYRAVSAGALPPPPTLQQSFKIATQNSFDYSAFLFIGFTSAIAYGQDAHKQLGDNASAYWAYYWRGFVDKTDGNYLVIFALPTIFRQDERYYALGTGSIGKRALYAASRVLITPDYHGHKSFNASEFVGRAMAQGISTTYYPSADRTLGALATRWGYAIMRDALTNTFREFWPDIATHVLHHHS